MTKHCPCSEVQPLPKCITGDVGPKPWLKWGVDIETLTKDEDCKALHHFMTCPEPAKITLREVQKKLRKVADKSLVHPASMSSMRDRTVGEIILLKSGTKEQWAYYQSDTDCCVFKQEPFFRYIFGCQQPDCYGVYEVRNKVFRLFVTGVSEAARPFLGDNPSMDSLRDSLGCESVQEVSELRRYLKKNPSRVYLLNGTNKDSGLKTRPDQIPDINALGIDEKRVDRRRLFNLLEEMRVTKTAGELRYLQCAAYISSIAHCAVMARARRDTYEICHEAIFKSVCIAVGAARNVAYTCICASNFNNNVLHYGHEMKPNDRLMKKGDLCLHDMGGIFPSGYVADITCTFPIGGRFSDSQKKIYDIVLKANEAVKSAMKPGVEWPDMHRLAEKIILEGLVELGLLKGDIVKMQEAGVGAYFQPHGLGHFVGLDVHDCGGHPDVSVMESFKGVKGLGIFCLRATRTLEAGQYITVEPGCYFIPYLLDELIRKNDYSDFVVKEKVEAWKNSPGVRIEDDVLVTLHGCENYAIVPRTTEEIEEFMSLHNKKTK